MFGYGDGDGASFHIRIKFGEGEIETPNYWNNVWAGYNKHIPVRKI